MSSQTQQQQQQKGGGNSKLATLVRRHFILKGAKLDATTTAQQENGNNLLLANVAVHVLKERQFAKAAGSTFDRAEIQRRAEKLEKSIAANNRRRIFLSYSKRPCKHAVQHVNIMARRLASKGYRISMDISKVDDNENAIRSCDVFVIFYNEEYKLDSKCLAEAVYAFEKLNKRTVIGVNMLTTNSNNGKPPSYGDRCVWLSLRNEYQFEPVFQDVSDRIRRFFEVGDMSGFMFDQTTYTFTAINVPLSSSTGYYPRNDDEEPIFKQMMETCDKPGRGLLVISGEAGSGKTMLVASLFTTRKPLHENVAVFWINCSNFDKNDNFGESSQEDFKKQLLKCATMADPNFPGQTIAQIVPHFQKLRIQPLFVFDHVANQAMLAYFVKSQGNAAQLSFCAIVRDDFRFDSSNDVVPVRQVERFNKMTSVKVKLLMEVHYGMKNKVSDDKLSKLADSCFGLPLIANLIYAELKFKNVTTWNQHVDKALLANRSPSSDSMVAKLYGLRLAGESKMQESFMTLRECFLTFLLFDASSPVAVADLELLWGLPASSPETREILEQLVTGSLISMAEQTTSESDGAEESYIVHQLLWEAALKRAILKFDGLAELRGKLLSKTTDGGLIDPFEIVRRNRCHLLWQLLPVIDAPTLAKICLKSSNGGSGSGGGGEAFLQFLYYHKGDEMSLLVKKILTTMTQQCRVDLVRKVVTTTTTTKRNKDDKEDNSILVDFFGKISESGGDATWLFLHQFFDNWHNYYNEVKWRANLTTPLLVAAVNDDLDTVQIHCYDVTKALSEAFVAACRCNAQRVVGHIVRKLPAILGLVAQRDILAADGADGLSALEFAAQNGHLAIVRLLLGSSGSSSKQTAKDTEAAALLLAVTNCHLEVARYLATRNANLITTASNDEGWTVFHSAAASGQLEMVRCLFEKHFNSKTLLKMATKSNETAADVARNHGFNVIANYLLTQ